MPADPMPASPPATPDLAATLTARQIRDPRTALGAAVVYLQKSPSFADRPFGFWAKVLIGQINRKHYRFIMQGERVVGFVGWGFVDQALCEDWLQNRGQISYEQSLNGDCILVNAWQADDELVNDAVRHSLRSVAAGRKYIFAKRFYPSGRIRHVKVPVTRFLAGHVTRGQAMFGA